MRAITMIGLLAALGGPCMALAQGDHTSARLMELSSQEQVLLDELAAIETRLLVVHTELDAFHIQERDLESRLVQLDQQLADAEARLDERQRSVEARVRALYMGSERGFLQLLFSARDIGELLQGSRYLAFIVEQDELLLADLHAQVERARRLREEREAEFALLQDRIADRQATQSEQRELRERRSSLLRVVRSDRRAVAIAAVEAERGEPALIEATRDPDEADAIVVVEPPTEAPEPVTPDEPLQLGFGRQKGRLIMPAIGDISGRFGWYAVAGADDQAFRGGIDIDAPAGTEVRAVYAGQVRRAEWLRGFGNTVILDHGEGYYTIYAHLDAPAVSIGEMVDREQVVGHVGDSGSTRGAYLHFQIREHSEEVDPLVWILLPPGVRMLDP